MENLTMQDVALLVGTLQLQVIDLQNQVTKLKADLEAKNSETSND